MHTPVYLLILIFFHFKTHTLAKLYTTLAEKGQNNSSLCFIKKSITPKYDKIRIGKTLPLHGFIVQYSLAKFPKTAYPSPSCRFSRVPPPPFLGPHT